MTLPEFLYRAALSRAREVELQTGWPADLLLPSENVATATLDAIGLRIDVDEFGVFDISMEGEFTFAEIVGDWRAEAQDVLDLTKDTLRVADLAARMGVSRPTAYKYLNAEDMSDMLVFALVGEPEVTYRGLWELSR